MGDADGGRADDDPSRWSQFRGVRHEWREVIMAKPFKGTVNVDIRDSEPDWVPFEPPVAPYAAPSVVYIVLDDVGFSAMRYQFTGGVIDRVAIDVSGEPYHDLEREAALMLMRE
jgi:hypothetical protein